MQVKTTAKKERKTKMALVTMLQAGLFREGPYQEAISELTAHNADDERYITFTIAWYSGSRIATGWYTVDGAENTGFIKYLQDAPSSLTGVSLRDYCCTVKKIRLACGCSNGA